MNKNISIFKKIKMFRTFKKIINENKTELEQKFAMRADNAKRLYTVLNIPEEVIGEPYNLRKTDIDKIAENFIKEYSFELGKYLDSKGLQELYEYYEIKKVEKYSYLVVLGFSLFKSNKYYNNIYYKIIPAISIVAIILSLIFFL
ncbi:MAG TPA: hypothetical protein PKG93_02640 [Bacilli bacterium]|nr:hypothetical protein [Bacilli bacterium]